MPTVLIVEDNLVVAVDIAELLRDGGYTVIGLADSFDYAVKLAEERRPDLAIIDFGLTGSQNGVAVASRLRALGVKVAYVTASADHVRAIDPKSHIVEKPFQAPDLLKALRRLL